MRRIGSMQKKEIEDILDELRPRIGPWRCTWKWKALTYATENLRIDVSSPVSGSHRAVGVHSKRTHRSASLSFGQHEEFSRADLEALIDRAEGIRKTGPGVEGSDE